MLLIFHTFLISHLYNIDIRGMDNNLLQDVTYAPNTLSPPLSVSFPNCLSSPLSVSFPSFSTNMSKFLPVPRVARAGTTANSGDHQLTKNCLAC